MTTTYIRNVTHHVNTHDKRLEVYVLTIRCIFKHFELRYNCDSILVRVKIFARTDGRRTRSIRYDICFRIVHDTSFYNTPNTSIRNKFYVPSIVKRPYLIRHFLFGSFQEFVCWWVHGTCKHEVLPDHDSKFVCYFVKLVKLVDLKTLTLIFNSFF